MDTVLDGLMTVGTVIAATEVVKRALPVPDWSEPFIAFGLGVGFGVGYAAIKGIDLVGGAVAGLTLGAAAAGTYSAGKTVYKSTTGR